MEMLERRILWNAKMFLPVLRFFSFVLFVLILGCFSCAVAAASPSESPTKSHPASIKRKSTPVKGKQGLPIHRKTVPRVAPVKKQKPRTKPKSRKAKRTKGKQNTKVLLEIRLLRKGKRDPIEGGGVFVLNLRRGKYTDEKGLVRFRLKPGKYKILARTVGFLKKIIKLELKKDLKLTLYQQEDPNNPFRTVTRAKRKKAEPQRVSITRKELSNMPGSLGGDPFRVLQNLPGVARSRGLSGRLRVRGASPSDTGFYLDGMPIPLLYHFGGGPSVMNDRFIESIDFFPGGAPVRFGRLTAGLVSVESREPSHTRMGGEFYIDLIHAGFFFEMPLSKHWSFAISARRSYVDALIPIYTSFSALAARYWDYQLKVAYKKRRHQFSVLIFGSDDLVDYKAPDEGADIPFLSVDRLYISIQFARALLSYRYKRGIFSFRTSVVAGFDKSHNDNPESDVKIWQIPVGLRSEVRLQPHKNFRVDLGVDGAWSRFIFTYRFPVGEFAGFPKPSFRPLYQEGDNAKNQFAPGGYLNVRWKIFKYLEAIGGVRADLYLLQDRRIWDWEPRLSLRMPLNKKWTLLLSAGIFHQPPNIQDWSEEVGNPDLLLQGARQYTFGAQYRPNRKIDIRLQGFYNDMFDRISRSNKMIRVDDKLIRENYNNNGTGRGYGLELLVKIKDFYRFSGWIAYTFSRSERGNVNSDTYTLYSYDQPHILNLLFNYRIGSGWSVGARFRLVSGRPTTPIKGSTYDADTDSFRPVYGESRSERYPTFHQLDLRVDKKWIFNTWILGLYLDLQNVYYAQTTERYRYQYDYQKRIPIPGLPIVPSFGIKGEF